MGEDYGQLCLEERVEIYRLHAAGKSQRAIAAALGRAPSTISREIRRNGKKTKAWSDGYAPVRAQKLAERRRRWDGRFKLVRQPDLRELVKGRLAMGWSPEQIAGRLTLEQAELRISHESIYRYAYHRSGQKDYWHRLLPRQKWRRGRKGRKGGSAVDRIKDRQSIDLRSAEADDRAVPGHWEADFMLFATYGQNLLVLHERSSRYLFLDHPPDRKAEPTAQRIATKLGRLPKRLRRSITFDNGSEFAAHGHIARKTRTPTFFCDPHSPWQKGGVENAIGRLRRWLPRKTSPHQIAPNLRQIAHAYNHTPRKCLDFKTPAEAFSSFHSTVALQT
ncbi:IS30 family transposase [Devosia sp.]|uniref:IS30 family transposase n=1 Tax=Devosia sp. TaxID=1871048 RepID=UPI002FC5870B